MCVPDGKHARDLLSFEGFVSFFEQVQPYAEHITLIGGEPLMYPWIDEVLDLLSEHPIAVTINTNATMLNEKISKKLLSLHELNLKCSIDAAQASSYYRIRGVDEFQRVTGNMKRFAERTRDFPQIRMIPVYVVMKENLGEVLPFIDFVEPLNPYRVEFHPVRHVMNWHVINGTGWIFDGKEQSCESFAEEYNSVMQQAAEKCKRADLTFEVQYV
jgi:sulfatase maturation enzyme AslB (radical SAM superfamily)